MKLVFTTLLALPILAFTSSFAMACKPEAQFIGTIANVLTTPKACYVHVVDFTNYQESMVCPLDVSRVTNNWIRVASCDYKQGDAISGYLTVDQQGSIVKE